MKAKKRTDPQKPRGVGLDKPCTSCGQAIYYNYEGPFEGICGRCTDRLLARHRTTKRGKTLLVERSGRSGRGLLIAVLAFLAGAAAALALHPYIHDHLPF